METQNLIEVINSLMIESMAKLINANSDYEIAAEDKNVANAIRQTAICSFHEGEYGAFEKILNLLDRYNSTDRQKFLDFLTQNIVINGQSIRKYVHVNPKIKVGDTVRMTDGSGCTDIDGDKKYIVFAYEHSRPIKELTGKVKKINQCSLCSATISNAYYVQDIIIEIDGILYRNCSNFVKRV